MKAPLKKTMSWILSLSMILSLVIGMDVTAVAASNAVSLGTPTWVSANSTFEFASPTVTLDSNATMFCLSVDAGSFTVGNTTLMGSTVMSGIDSSYSYISTVTTSDELVSLTVTGSEMTPADIQAFLGNITFTYSSGMNVSVSASSLELGDNMTSLVINGVMHYYEYVSYSNDETTTSSDRLAGCSIAWDTAYNAAKATSFNGLTGYLATITSATEHNFIFQNLNGCQTDFGNTWDYSNQTSAHNAGWIGGTRFTPTSDFAYDDSEISMSTSIASWKWADGPEADTDFDYTNWAGGQPDGGSGNYGGVSDTEGYAQYGFGSSGQWNDLSIGNKYQTEASPAKVYGYYVEYSTYGGQTETVAPATSTVTLTDESFVQRNVPNLTFDATANDEENYIHLEWNNDDNSETYHYMVTKTDVSTGVEQTIPLNNTARVLNIYPGGGTPIEGKTDLNGKTIDTSASVKGWMDDDGYGTVNSNQLITVDSVYIDDFNTNPESYLYEDAVTHLYNYDVVFVGAWDANNNKDLATDAMNTIQTFITAGGGYLAGHDTTIGENLRSLAVNNTNLIYNTYCSNYGDTWIGSNIGVNVVKKGSLINYPWTLDSTQLSIPDTHSTSEFAKGDVWMEFAEHRLPYGGLIISLDGYSGTNNFYLTTWNNAAQIQTGHSNGQATADEKKVLANTLLYLSQVTIATSFDDHTGQDITAPDAVPSGSASVSVNGEGKAALTFTAPNDNGNTYQYKLKAIGNISDNTYSSDTVSETITSGVNGYAVVIDQNSDTDPGDTVTTTNSSYTSNVLESGNWYYHIKAIDKAGNVSATTHIAFSVDPLSLSNDATLKTTSMVKGEPIENLGTPAAALINLNGGTVTLSTTQAADISNVGSFITNFIKNDDGATVKAIKYSKDAIVTESGIETDAAYANEGISNEDFFIIRVTAADGETINYYRIQVAVTPTAPNVTADDTSNIIGGIDSTMEYTIDGGSWTVYDAENPPDLSGSHSVQVRVMGSKTIPASETATLTFTTNNTYNVTGTVVDDTQDQNRVEGATVKVKLGDAQYGTTATTDVNGHFTITGVPNGMYNLVVTKGERIITLAVTVKDGNCNFGEQFVVLPVGNKNSELDIRGDDTPSVVVDGLNDLFADENAYTTDDEIVVNGGGTVKITLTVEKQDSVSAAGSSDLQNKAGSQTIDMYLDMTLLSTKTDAENNTTSKALHTVDSLLKIVVPYNLSGKTNITIYRYHDGVAQKMTRLNYSTTPPTVEGYMLNTTDNQIIIWTKNFSTYAIAYGSTGSSGGSGSSSRSTGSSFSITVNQGAGGTVSPSGTVSVTKDGSKTFNFTPSEGYVISDVLVDGKSVGSVNSYTFSNVTTSHTLSVVYDKVSGLPYYYGINSKKVFIGFAADDTGTMNYIAPMGTTVLFQKNPKNFRDIAGHWGKSYIDFVTEREIFVGTENNIFSPNTGMTRAMLATVIGRLYERSYGTLTTTGTHSFTDCDYNSWYGPYIDWCSENGIIMGMGDGLFDPNRQVNRQEMAAMLYRFAEFLKMTGRAIDGNELKYSDASSISTWAHESALYCQETGIISGRDGGTFAPFETATRAEVAAILERFILLVV